VKGAKDVYANAVEGVGTKTKDSLTDYLKTAKTKKDTAKAELAAAQSENPSDIKAKQEAVTEATDAVESAEAGLKDFEDLQATLAVELKTKKEYDKFDKANLGKRFATSEEALKYKTDQLAVLVKGINENVNKTHLVPGAREKANHTLVERYLNAMKEKGLDPRLEDLKSNRPGHSPLEEANTKYHANNHHWSTVAQSFASLTQALNGLAQIQENNAHQIAANAKANASRANADASMVDAQMKIVEQGLQVFLQAINAYEQAQGQAGQGFLSNLCSAVQQISQGIAQAAAQVR